MRALVRYRCAKPVLIRGRILSTGEFVRLPPTEGEALVESGHLIVIAEVNGNGRQWTQPEVR